MFYEHDVATQSRAAYVSVINCCRMVFLSGKHAALLSLILLACEGGVVLRLDPEPHRAIMSYLLPANSVLIKKHTGSFG